MWQLNLTGGALRPRLQECVQRGHLPSGDRVDVSAQLSEAPRTQVGGDGCAKHAFRIKLFRPDHRQVDH